MARDNEHGRREQMRMEAETAGVRQQQDKAARQAELLRELGPAAEVTDRLGVFSIPAETGIPAGWTVAGHVPGPQGMRLLVRKTGQ